MAPSSIVPRNLSFASADGSGPGPPLSEGTAADLSASVSSHMGDGARPTITPVLSLLQSEAEEGSSLSLICNLLHVGVAG